LHVPRVVLAQPKPNAAMGPPSLSCLAARLGFPLTPPAANSKNCPRLHTNESGHLLEEPVLPPPDMLTLGARSQSLPRMIDSPPPFGRRAAAKHSTRSVLPALVLFTLTPVPGQA